jgi:hypothetical protein
MPTFIHAAPFRASCFFLIPFTYFFSTLHFTLFTLLALALALLVDGTLRRRWQIVNIPEYRR